MDEIIKFIERVQQEETHHGICWADKCVCDLQIRINTRIAEMWYANRARPMKYLIGKCTCGHKKSIHDDSGCRIDYCSCAKLREIK